MLGLAVGVATHEVPFPGMIAIPLLFAAGMSLIDTADGALMERFDRVTSFTGEQPCGGQVGGVAAECVEASGLLGSPPAIDQAYFGHLARIAVIVDAGRSHVAALLPNVDRDPGWRRQLRSWEIGALSLASI